MPTDPHPQKPEFPFDEACALVEAALAARPAILDDVARPREFGKALQRLRDDMRANAWMAGTIDLDPFVRRYDRRTRQEGLHALHDWDGKADRFNDDSIPVDVLNYLIHRRGTEATDRRALAILLDYYFMHVLALLSLRAWDEGRADAQLDRLNALVATLQGPGGSGQPFADDAETLILIATAHYEPVEEGYDLLLARVRTLNDAHRLRIAVGHAAAMGCHLRFGFEATYGRNTTTTRNDNVADYPWLCFALATLMHEYARLREAGVHGPARDVVVESMLNGLSGDARAFIGAPPASLSSCEDERAGFCARFEHHRDDLLREFEPYRPTDTAYSPLAFFFNFSHNVLKGTIVDALLRGEPWPLTVDDLLTGLERGAPKNALRRALAETLMGHARANPDMIRGRLMPVIVYDPRTGRQAFAATMEKLRQPVRPPASSSA